MEQMAGVDVRSAVVQRLASSLWMSDMMALICVVRPIALPSIGAEFDG